MKLSDYVPENNIIDDNGLWALCKNDENTRYIIIDMRHNPHSCCGLMEKENDYYIVYIPKSYGQGIECKFNTFEKAKKYFNNYLKEVYLQMP